MQILFTTLMNYVSAHQTKLTGIGMSVLPANPPKVTKNIAGFRQQLTELPAFRALLRSVEVDFYTHLPMPSPVLDLGCGDGHFASVAFNRTLTIGLDPWWEPLREAQSRARYQWLTHASGATAPFADASFATIISNSVLEHIPALDPVLHEASRILKPGGWFYFCVPSPHFRRYLSRDPQFLRHHRQPSRSQAPSVPLPLGPERYTGLLRRWEQIRPRAMG